MAHAVEATEPGYVVRTRDVHRTDRRGQVHAAAVVIVPAMASTPSGGGG